MRQPKHLTKAYNVCKQSGSVRKEPLMKTYFIKKLRLCLSSSDRGVPRKMFKNSRYISQCCVFELFIPIVHHCYEWYDRRDNTLKSNVFTK